jgi:hypothetical protein
MYKATVSIFQGLPLPSKQKTDNSELSGPQVVTELHSLPCSQITLDLERPRGAAAVSKTSTVFDPY